jgi:hypothetical protein
VIYLTPLVMLLLAVASAEAAESDLLSGAVVLFVGLVPVCITRRANRIRVARGEDHRYRTQRYIRTGSDVSLRSKRQSWAAPDAR